MRPGRGTREVQTNVVAPSARSRRSAETPSMHSSRGSGSFTAGATTKLALRGDFYVGLGVSAHDKDDVQTAVLSPCGKCRHSRRPTRRSLFSTARWRRCRLRPATGGVSGATGPRDGSYFLFNLRRAGSIAWPWTVEPMRLPRLGAQKRCNNDHGISPDATTSCVSDSSQTGKSMVYTLPIAGGAPHQITNAPSYWHGWSPDGSTLAFTGQRGDNFDIYTIAAGRRRGLLTAPGSTTARNISLDAEHHFNSERTGAHADLADACRLLPRTPTTGFRYFSRWQMDSISL